MSRSPIPSPAIIASPVGLQAEALSQLKATEVASLSRKEGAEKQEGSPVQCTFQTTATETRVLKLS